jgi:hypothetical protein
MKKLILIIVASAFAFGIKAQDTINYIVVYQQSGVGMPTTFTRIAGFRTQGNLTDFLNTSLDSTASPVIYDVRTKKPLTASFSTVEVQEVVKQRKRKWTVR